MNKFTIALGILLLAGIGWFMFQGSSVSYTATFENEVAALETELASLEAEVTAGTLSPEEAAQAQVRIATRLNAINDSVESSNKAKLTAEQKTQLLGGLDTLSRVLTKYSSTLVSIDAAVMTLPENERPKLNVRGSTSSSRGIAAAVAETVSNVIEHAEEMVDVFVPEIDAEAVIEAEIENHESDMNESDTMDDSSDDMTDESMNDDDTTMEDTSSDTSGDTSEIPDSEAAAEVEAEAEAEITI